MFFLLRIGFWLTIVALLLPAFSGGTEPHDETRPRSASIDPVDALAAAGSAVADAGGFCERQPHACAVGAQLLGAVGERVEAAAHLAVAYVLEQISEEKRRAAARAAGDPAGDTLTTHDLTPIWQGPSLPALADPSSARSVDAAQPSPAQPRTEAPDAPESVIPRPPKKPA